jgi:hypothetical protein
VEDPKYARGLVKREVTRVLSPGTLLEDSFFCKASGRRAATTFWRRFVPIKTDALRAVAHRHLNRRVSRRRSDCRCRVVKATPSRCRQLQAAKSMTEYSANGSLGTDGSTRRSLPQSADQTPLAADESQLRWAKVREELLRFCTLRTSGAASTARVRRLLANAAIARCAPHRF